MVFTDTKSPGEEMANPASTMSTPSFSSCRAISTFSFRFMLIPGDCSPSLSVVSKTRMVRLSAFSFFSIFSASRSFSSPGVGFQACAGS